MKSILRIALASLTGFLALFCAWTGAILFAVCVLALSFLLWYELGLHTDE